MKQSFSTLLFVLLAALTAASIIMSARATLQFAQQLPRPAAKASLRVQPTPAAKLNAAPTPVATGAAAKRSAKLSS